MKLISTVAAVAVVISSGAVMAAKGVTGVNIVSCGVYEITCNKDISNVVYRANGKDTKFDGLSGHSFMLESENVTNIWVKCGNNASAKRGYGKEYTFSVDNNGCGGEKEPLAAVGDLFWNDVNKNGRYDAGEPGIGGVEMCLKDSNGQEIASVATDPTGYYEFTNLPANQSYSVCVKALPANYELCPANSGSNDNADSDINGGSMTTDPVLLSPGENNTSIDGCAYKLGI